MRRSRYNVILREGSGEEALLFNTALAAIGPSALVAFEGMSDAAASPAPPDLSEADELTLLRAGFLTELSPDEELRALRERFDAARRRHDRLVLSIVPTYACNYRCPYCYEQDKVALGGMMGADVQDAVVGFAAGLAGERRYSEVEVQWYGGDPSLALDVVEGLSGRLISLCDERGIGYVATILTNCNRIDEDAADMLARCRVRSALLTIDGFEDMHNSRRVAADGSNSFERVVDAARLFLERGIVPAAVMNADRLSIGQYRPLRDWLRAEVGVELQCCRLSDCGHFYGSGNFRPPYFDLLDPGEFARAQHAEFAADAAARGGFRDEELRGLLASPPFFCNGQREDYFVIDCFGDVYKCDGYVGDRSHVRFNLLDKKSAESLEEALPDLMSHDPFEDPECKECFLLPICLGNCDWERRTDSMQCHPLKITLPDYLLDWRTCFPERAAGGACGVVRLA